MLKPKKLDPEKEAELHSISVKYEGKTILEGAWKPFTLEDPQMMHSLSKTGTAICVGFALDEEAGSSVS